VRKKIGLDNMEVMAALISQFEKEIEGEEL
jgi:hypothetical protein